MAEYKLKKQKIKMAEDVLSGQYPSDEYRISCIIDDVPGWFFFRIIEKDNGDRTDFSPRHNYEVVRKNHTVVRGNRNVKLSELGKIYKEMDLFNKRYSPNKIAEVALCLTGSGVLIEERDARRLSSGNGYPVTAPSVKKQRGKIIITFYSVHYGMSIGVPVKYHFTVKKDYSIETSRHSSIF